MFEIFVLVLSGALLMFVPDLWELANDAKTSYMSSFWFVLLAFDLFYGAVSFYLIGFAWKERLLK